MYVSDGTACLDNPNPIREESDTRYQALLDGMRAALALGANEWLPRETDMPPPRPSNLEIQVEANIAEASETMVLGRVVSDGLTIQCVPFFPYSPWSAFHCVI